MKAHVPLVVLLVLASALPHATAGSSAATATAAGAPRKLLQVSHDHGSPAWHAEQQRVLQSGGSSQQQHPGTLEFGRLTPQNSWLTVLTDWSRGHLPAWMLFSEMGEGVGDVYLHVARQPRDYHTGLDWHAWPWLVSTPAK